MNQNLSFIAPQPLITAVLFLVFNRLDTTKKVFDAIRQAKPPRLYIASDGARSNKESESEKVQIVRDYIIENIDWECEVRTLFREENLGCKYAVSGAISWFFETEENGIILEDDCLPSQSFFWYCESLLDKYKNDDSVYLISGDSRASESFEMLEDYAFCKYPMVWGWASWRRVWNRYDPELIDWPNQKDELPKKISSHGPTIKFWKNIFDRMYNKEIDTWDHQLSYLLLSSGGKCIVPKINLITNIGFGKDATHTTNSKSASANRESYEMVLPLRHAINNYSEQKINNFYDKNEFSYNSLITRVISKCARIIKN
jgi:hypothetical protein